jgi:predicted nucleic acid-binding protein
MAALLDTGVLLAAIAKNDDMHEVCALAMDETPNVLLPDVVLPEVAYMVMRDMEVSDLMPLLSAIASREIELVMTTPEDVGRAAEILKRYEDARVDFVDCVIVAMAERLEITQIPTIDRRHFSLFRPRHCERFELIP